MTERDIRFMQLMVFFDLPTKTRTDRRHATRFRQFLLADGYQMLQWSVYVRICKGMDTMEKHVSRLKKCLPPRGSVRVLRITDRQFAAMEILVGNRRKFEEYCDDVVPLF